MKYRAVLGYVSKGGRNKRVLREIWTFIVVRALNGDDKLGLTKQSRKRILELVTAVNEAAAMDGIEIIRKPELWPKMKAGSFTITRELDEKWREVNRMLADYPITHTFDFTSDPSEPWELGNRNRGVRPELEFSIALNVMELIKAGLIGRICKCICGKWFFAKRDNQKSCGSAGCRHKRYEGTERVKEHRRLYMQWWYAMYQSPKAPKKKLTFEQWQEQRAHRKAGTHGTR